MHDWEQLGKEFEKWYGKPLPNPDHEPKQFAYLLRLFLRIKDMEKAE